MGPEGGDFEEHADEGEDTYVMLAGLTILEGGDGGGDTYKARKMKASLAFLRLQPRPGGAWR